MRSLQAPRGCRREIQKYHTCKANSTDEACFDQKINIMEICPEHVLEGLRERKKWFLRAELIDNDTYKRAMKVSDYNKGKSVNELELKTWSYGRPNKMRTDSTWQDDRYDPSKYPHPHRNDSINFPDQEYSDFFGGTLGQKAREEQLHYKPGVFGADSKAMVEFREKQSSQEKK